MKTKQSVRNSIVAFLSNILAIIIGLIAQAIFIQLLGTEYLGINGLFNNIISMLALVELGIGSAITFNLYQPLVEKNKVRIQSLMHFYKKSYRIIAIVVFLIGISLIPILPHLVAKTTVNIPLQIIYLFFLIDLVCSYLLSYKRNILYADQKNYIINIVHIVYLIILNTLQLSLVALTKNYYLYLTIKIIMRILENIVISLIVNRKYPYLKEKNSKPLDKEVEQDILKKVKALIFHKIGSFVVTGTDNIIIAKFLGVVTVGLYSNYYLILNAVSTMFSQIIISTTASIGHLLVEKDYQKNFTVFQRIRFLNFWLSTFASISVLTIMQSFITIWIGEKYLLSPLVLIVLVINLFQTLMRYSYSVFKEAAGIYYEDRFVPLIEAIVNIIASLIFLKFFGLAGVFMGTLLSSLILWCFSYPKYVHKKLFQQSYTSYIKQNLSYTLLFILLASITYFIASKIDLNQIYLNLISNIGISILIPNLILLLLFNRTEHFKYYKNFIKSIGKRKEKKNEKTI